MIANIWPDRKTEATMLEDARLLESEFEPTSTGHDAACHIKALLCRVRDLELLLHQLRTQSENARLHLLECSNILRGFVGLPRVSALAAEQAEKLLAVLSRIES